MNYFDIWFLIIREIRGVFSEGIVLVLIIQFRHLIIFLPRLKYCFHSLWGVLTTSVQWLISHAVILLLFITFEPTVPLGLINLLGYSNSAMVISIAPKPCSPKFHSFTVVGLLQFLSTVSSDCPAVIIPILSDSQILYIVSFFKRALSFPKTAGHCSFKQMLLKQEEI